MFIGGLLFLEFQFSNRENKAAHFLELKLILNAMNLQQYASNKSIIEVIRIKEAEASNAP